MSNTIEKLYAAGQSIWCDNVSRAMLDGGELRRLIGLGIVGVTSNPTIFMKAITGSHDYDQKIGELHARGLDTMAVYEGLVIPDIRGRSANRRPCCASCGGSHRPRPAPARGSAPYTRAARGSTARRPACRSS